MMLLLTSQAFSSILARLGMLEVLNSSLVLECSYQIYAVLELFLEETFLASQYKYKQGVCVMCKVSHDCKSNHSSWNESSLSKDFKNKNGYEYAGRRHSQEAFQMLKDCCDYRPLSCLCPVCTVLRTTVLIMRRLCGLPGPLDCALLHLCCGHFAYLQITREESVLRHLGAFYFSTPEPLLGWMKCSKTC